MSAFKHSCPEIRTSAPGQTSRAHVSPDVRCPAGHSEAFRVRPAVSGVRPGEFHQPVDIHGIACLLQSSGAGYVVTLRAEMTANTLTSGQQVGAWTLLQYRAGRYENGAELRPGAWKCQCSCGALRWVNAGNLRSGQSKSCGCTYRGVWKSRNLKPINSVFSMGGA